MRDVIFQKDLFEYYNSNISFLGVALEDGNLSERTNKKWIIDAYGMDIYNSIKNQRIKKGKYCKDRDSEDFLFVKIFPI